MIHGTLTVITPIRPSELGRLRTALSKADTQKHELFSRFPKLHFARWVVVDSAPGKQEPNTAEMYLVFAADFCTEGKARKLAERFLAIFVRSVDAQTLDEIYGCCDGYPGAGTFEERGRYLLEHTHESSARHVDFIYRAEQPGTLKQALELKKQLDQHLDQLRRRGAPPSPEALRKQWAHHPALSAPKVTRDRRLARASAARATFWQAPLAFAMDALMYLSHGLSTLTRRWKGPRPPARLPNVEPRFTDRQVMPDGPAQNPMAHVAAFKPGIRRMLVARVLMWLVNWRMQRYLVGLNQVTSIHCARWVVFKSKNDEPRLLFLSNYDGSWDGYIDSFIDTLDVHYFLKLMWQRTKGFQDTSSETFKFWIRERLIPTPVFYNAYHPQRPSISDLHEAVRLRESLRPTGDVAELNHYVRTGSCKPEEMMPSLRESMRAVRALWPQLG